MNVYEKNIKNLLDTTSEALETSINLLNAERNVYMDGEIIGNGRPDYTQDSTEYSMSIDGKEFVLVDVPGIEGNEKKFEKIIANSLRKSHLVFYVNSSSKKIEKETLLKIEKYMRDKTSLYLIINVRCLGKKNRVVDIDGLYSDELKEVYKKCNSIKKQIEEELKSVLGDKFKGSIIINGLLGFCCYAYDKNNKQTTIKVNEDKGLRSAQTTFFKEFDNNLDYALEWSQINKIVEVINDKSKHFEEWVYNENIDKLKDRLNGMIKEIITIKDTIANMVRGFENEYDTLLTKYKKEKDEFIDIINKGIGREVSKSVFEEIKSEVFEMIEKEGGNVNKDKYKIYFENKENEIKNNLVELVNKIIKEKQNEFQNKNLMLQERFIEDLKRVNVKYNAILIDKNIDFDVSFVNDLKIGLKDIFKYGIDIANFAFDGAMLPLGSFGKAIAAGIGALFGIFNSIIKYFISKEDRINKAKYSIAKCLDDKCDEMSNAINEEIRALSIDEDINNQYKKIVEIINDNKGGFSKLVETFNYLTMKIKENIKAVEV